MAGTVERLWRLPRRGSTCVRLLMCVIWAPGECHSWSQRTSYMLHSGKRRRRGVRESRALRMAMLLKIVALTLLILHLEGRRPKRGPDIRLQLGCTDLK
ncbi:hypothetical protein B0H12DRAFT_281114 [Mycena haematopus]|nr:hypothetical protein B0H12DRAFT_281114 [Mycena haematopus]